MEILKRIPVKKNMYENFHENSLVINFICPDSYEENNLNLLEEFKLLEGLVLNNDLHKDDIVKNGMAHLTNKFDSHLGLFSVFSNLAAYYKLFKCDNCNKDYMVVFGYGESQPSRNVAYVSGIWEVK